jgi:hypothetical protein
MTNLIGFNCIHIYTGSFFVQRGDTTLAATHETMTTHVEEHAPQQQTSSSKITRNIYSSNSSTAKSYTSLTFHSLFAMSARLVREQLRLSSQANLKALEESSTTANVTNKKKRRSTQNADALKLNGNKATRVRTARKRARAAAADVGEVRRVRRLESEKLLGKKYSYACYYFFVVVLNET